MKTIIKTLTVIFVLLLSPIIQAQSLTPEMKKALHDFVAIQNLDKLWATIIDGEAKNGIEGIKRGAIEKLEQASSLTDAQRANAKKIMIELAPQLADEVTAMHKKIDIVSLVTDMTETIYPKYYTVQEIRDLSNFYGSMAFRKTAVFGQEVAAESKRTGESKEMIWRNYEYRFSEQERQFMLDFNNSATGKKQKTIGAKVNAESMDFFYNRTMPAMDKIADHYGEMLTKRLKETSSN
ncbi:hypothetical protein [Undibacterium sp. TJN19]|uniref:hypothetical protein n=1 Tax=Undibacterium sp. TJN19 TaxID=3413055 RepID=UPI003BF0F32B